jgi:uncharacterized protein (DUF58 family)
VELFDGEFLKKLEYLALVSRRVFRGRLLAQQRTRELGAGLEFAEHRDYTPGEDFRYVDWNLYARHGELLIKRFQEEEDLHVYLLLDGSRSMAGGAPAKFDYARQVAAALAYIALDDLNRVAVTVFAGEVVADFPLTRGKGHVLSLMRFLDQLEPAGATTQMARAVEQFVRRGQRSGLAVVISDFFDPAGYRRALDLLRYRQFEPHLIQLHAPEDAAPRVLGDVRLEDVETGAARQVTVTEARLRAYRRVYAEFLAGLVRYSRRYGLGCTCTPTTVPFDDLLLGMMRSAGVLR